MDDKSVIHGRVNPTNIMWFSTDFTWKFIDMAYASRSGDRVSVQAMKGKYAAPEINRMEEHLLTHSHLQHTIDMWSFGAIALEMLTGMSTAS